MTIYYIVYTNYCQADFHTIPKFFHELAFLDVAPEAVSSIKMKTIQTETSS